MSERDDAVIQRKGFTKIRGQRYETVNGNTRIRIERQGRMHRFGGGYQDRGPAVPIFTGNEKDARHVYEVLKEWFASPEDE